jgi:RNA polymerase sigma-70 factor, ECF subfamily
VGAALDKQLENLFWHILQTNDVRFRRIARKYAAADDTQDLYQEILLQLWRSLGKYEGRARPDTWAYKVALNTARSFRRRGLRRLDESLVNEPMEFWGFEGRTTYTGIPRSPSWILQEFADSLSDSDCMLFLMYLQDLSYQRISEITGLSRMHIAVKINRIKRLFIKYLRL